ncbi:MAG: hypothetical protein A2X09_08570 [Bacteroidetes bacterium GWF2_43_11]|nr:MAG: hypothetical protein A2X09_08570 [Bacteroidetes bacterium GWF2_43_11]
MGITVGILVKAMCLYFSRQGWIRVARYAGGNTVVDESIFLNRGDYRCNESGCYLWLTGVLIIGIAQLSNIS